MKLIYITVALGCNCHSNTPRNLENSQKMLIFSGKKEHSVYTERFLTFIWCLAHHLTL